MYKRPGPLAHVLLVFLMTGGHALSDAKIPLAVREDVDIDGAGRAKIFSHS